MKQKNLILDRCKYSFARSKDHVLPYKKFKCVKIAHNDSSIDEIYYLCAKEGLINQCEEIEKLLTSAVTDFERVFHSLKLVN